MTEREDATGIVSTLRDHGCQYSCQYGSDLDVDRHRFTKRARELNDCARLVERLTCMPDRATEKDFRQAAELMRSTAIDLEELTKMTPTGCICRRIQDDNYDYLDYAEACLHHRQLYVLREKLKEDYKKMERALKDKPRMRVILAALTGAALTEMGAGEVEHGVNVESRVYSALALADAVVRRLAETA